MKKQKGYVEPLLVIGILVIALVVVVMLALPKYSVWVQKLAGKAELVRAESNRQIATLEAKQKMESAEYLNKAEVIRAKGVAEANKIIADGLGGSEGYLRYLWIQSISDSKNAPQIIYIPTEAGLPLLEAGKRN